MMSATTPSPALIGSPDARKRLVLVAMDKGGVGKSFFSILFVQWLQHLRRDFLAFDPDYQNSTLTRFVPDSQFLDIRHSENLDRIIEVMVDASLVIVDGVGSQQRIFLDWLEETNLLTLRREMNLELTLVVIIEEDKDTVHQAGEAVSRIGRLADWVVVKNQKNMPTSRIYDQSRARQELENAGSREVVIPKLQDHLVLFLQQQSVTITGSLEGNKLSLIDRQRMTQYRRRIFDQFEANRDILLP